MVDDRQAPGDMELAEVFAKIMSDVSEGTRDSLRLQEERESELVALASLDPAEFARLTVSDAEVDDELVCLFPSAEAGRPHAVYEGAPYEPPRIEVFATIAGVALTYGDYVSGPDALTGAGVAKIRNAIRVRLAGESQTALRKSLSRGFPRVIVDSGKVSAAILLRLDSSTTKRRRAKNARLLVRMVDDRDPQSRDLRVDIVSRLEVTFKTIS
jgi:hypothetical protein